MRTANNTYTVENLVAKYRNFVKENCPKQLVSCVANDKFVEDEVPNESFSKEVLILSLYKSVAGENANEFVVKAIEEYVSDYKKYYESAFTEEEFSFLAMNFSGFMDCIIKSFPDVFSVQSRLDLVKSYLSPEDGAKVYLANTGFDVACQYANCRISGFFDSEECLMRWAIGQIYLFSKGIQSDIQSAVFYESTGYSVSLPEDDSVNYVVYGAHEDTTFDDILALYKTLSPKGKMLAFVDKTNMHGRNEKYREFRKVLVKEKALSSIIAYRDVIPFTEAETNNILLVIEKKGNDTVDMVSLSTNRQMSVNSNSLTPDCLWPSFYMTTRPKVGIPLSQLAYCPSRKEDFAKFKEQIGGRFQYEEYADGTERLVLPEWMLNLSIPTAIDLGIDFKDANLCDKELFKVSESSFDFWRGRIRVVEQPCVLIAAEYDSPHKLHVGYYDKVTDRGFARTHGMPCLFPKEGIDVRYLAAILLMPEIRDQIMSINDGGHLFDSDFSLMLDLIIVPEHNEMERLSFLAEAYYNALVSSQQEMKQEKKQYTKSIRMRKHALTQTLSSIEAMFYALNSYRIRKEGNIADGDIISRVKGTTVREAFEFLSKNIEDMMPALEHIAEIDYSFNQPEWIDPEKFIEGYITKNENGWLNFKPVITWENGHNLAKKELKDPFSGEIILKEGDALNLFSFPKDALNRIFDNVISNAQAHGFTTPERKDYQLRFSWHTDGIALIIEIENNGTPIPADREASSLLEYGVSTALHQAGHNGIGCNEIDDIMQRYDGHVKIVSSPDKDFTVKYVLTFNRTNTIGTYNL